MLLDEVMNHAAINIIRIRISCIKRLEFLSEKLFRAGFACFESLSVCFSAALCIFSMLKKVRLPWNGVATVFTVAGTNWIVDTSDMLEKNYLKLLIIGFCYKLKYGFNEPSWFLICCNVKTAKEFERTNIEKNYRYGTNLDVRYSSEAPEYVPIWPIQKKTGFWCFFL